MYSLEERLMDAGYDGVKILAPDFFDDAFIGVSHDGRAVYSYDIIVNLLMEHDGMTAEEAVEYTDYNTVRALDYEGPDAPIIVYDLMD